MWTTVTPSTPTRMTRTTTTHAICTSEHGSALVVVCHVSLIMCHTTLAQVHWVFHITSSACCTCVVLFDLHLSPFPLQPVLLRFLSLLCPDVPWPADQPLRPGLRGKWPAPLRQGRGYDDTHSLTGYEPNDTELNNTVSDEFVYSQGPLANVTPSSDQDIDDTTLGKLLTEAHREYADYLSLESVLVSRSSMSVVFDRTGKPVGERNVDQSIGFGVTRNTYSALNQFPAITQAEKWSIERGNLWEKSLELLRSEIAPAHRLGLCLMNREKWSSQNAARKFLITNSKQLEQNKIVKFYKKNYGVSKKDFREVHQQSLTEMEELRKFQCSTLDTLTRQKLIED